MESNTDRQNKLWFLPILTGIIFILLGIWMFRTPLEAFVAMALFFAVAFLVSGTFEIINALSNRKADNFGWMLVGGLLDLIIGIILVSSPALSMLALALFVGVAILFRSVLSIGIATQLKKMGFKNWLWPLLLGIIGLVLAVMILVSPQLGGLTLVFYVGFALLTIGILQIFFGARLRRWGI